MPILAKFYLFFFLIIIFLLLLEVAGEWRGGLLGMTVSGKGPLK